MRVLPALAAIAVCCALIMPAGANADDFGPRFWNKAPAGLGDYTAPNAPVQNMAQTDEADQTAEDLQKIMPAAGEEKADPSKNIAAKDQASK